MEKNIGCHLNLPSFMIDFIDNHQDEINSPSLYKSFIDLEDEKVEFTTIELLRFSYLQSKLYEEETNSELKKIRLVVLMHLYDTYHYLKLRDKCTYFRILVNSMIDRIKNAKLIKSWNKPFVNYFSNAFISNRRFLSVKKNKEYRSKVFRNQMRVVMISNYMFEEAMKKRYMPVIGEGYKQSFSEFKETIMNI